MMIGTFTGQALEPAGIFSALIVGIACTITSKLPFCLEVHWAEVYIAHKILFGPMFRK
jgi:hypothetical protein